MTTKRWVSMCLLGTAWIISPAGAQVQQLGRIPVQERGQVRAASHCDGCSDLGPLWSPASCAGDCDVVPRIVGPACRPCCRTVLGEFVGDVRCGVDRTLRCVLGAVLPCGLRQGRYDVCSSTACSGGCMPACESCCDMGCGCTDSCTSGCTDGGCGGCAGGCSGDAGGMMYQAPMGTPTPAAADPFQDDPPAPITSSSRAVRRSPNPSAQANRSSAQRRPQIRRTTYQRPAADQ